MKVQAMPETESLDDSRLVEMGRGGDRDAFGQIAIAWNFADGGQFGVAHDYACGTTAHATEVNTSFVRQLAISNPFFRFCWTVLRPTGYWLIWAWAIPMTISMFTMGSIVRNRMRRECLAKTTV